MEDGENGWPGVGSGGSFQCGFAEFDRAAESGEKRRQIAGENRDRVWEIDVGEDAAERFGEVAGGGEWGLEVEWGRER